MATTLITLDLPSDQLAAGDYFYLDKKGAVRLLSNQLPIESDLIYYIQEALLCFRFLESLLPGPMQSFVGYLIRDENGDDLYYGQETTPSIKVFIEFLLDNPLVYMDRVIVNTGDLVVTP